MSKLDLTGQRFGKLTVIEEDEPHYTSGGSKKTRWKCKCDCGNEITIRQSDLRDGSTKSCGCLHKEYLKRKAKSYNHRERLYVLWIGIRQRCRNPNNISYKWYGAKGIKVCKEWENDYLSFKKWAIDNGYDETLPRGAQTIERLDVSKGYCPENCTWKTIKEQQRNKGNARLFEYKGEKHTVVEWSEIMGIDYTALHSRIFSCGWSIKEALERPIRHKKTQKYKYDGRNLTISEWSKEIGVPERTLRYRLSVGKLYSDVFSKEKYIYRKTNNEKAEE